MPDIFNEVRNIAWKAAQFWQEQKRTPRFGEAYFLRNRYVSSWVPDSVVSGFTKPSTRARMPVTMISLVITKVTSFVFRLCLLFLLLVRRKKKPTPLIAYLQLRTEMLLIFVRRLFPLLLPRLLVLLIKTVSTLSPTELSIKSSPLASMGILLLLHIDAENQHGTFLLFPRGRRYLLIDPYVRSVIKFIERLL